MPYNAVPDIFRNIIISQKSIFLFFNTTNRSGDVPYSRNPVLEEIKGKCGRRSLMAACQLELLTTSLGAACSPKKICVLRLGLPRLNTLVRALLTKGFLRGNPLYYSFCQHRTIIPLFFFLILH